MTKWAMEERGVVLFVIGTMCLVCDVSLASVFIIRAHVEYSNVLM